MKSFIKRLKLKSSKDPSANITRLEYLNREELIEKAQEKNARIEEITD